MEYAVQRLSRCCRGYFQQLQKKPSKLVYYSFYGGGCYLLASQNPKQDSYSDQVRLNSQKLLFVGEAIRNKKSLEYVKDLEQKLNDDLVCRVNFILFSVIWLKSSRDDCNLYKAVCPYLKPSLKNFFDGFVDIGALNRWLIMDKNMLDYDIKEDPREIQSLENPL